MAARKKKRPLRPRAPSRVKKRTRPSKRSRGHHHAEAVGLALLASGLFLATILYLGWPVGNGAVLLLEEMLLAAGVTATERIVARQRSHVGGEARVALVVCLLSGVLGGLAGLGG